MEIFDKIFLKDLKGFLPYKDSRSIAVYCKRNNIAILGDEKRQYVLAVQFTRALLVEKIRGLKKAYGEKWIEALKADMCVCAQHQAMLDDLQSVKQSIPPINKRSPIKGDIEARFLLDIQTALELASSSAP